MLVNSKIKNINIIIKIIFTTGRVQQMHLVVYFVFNFTEALRVRILLQQTANGECLFAQCAWLQNNEK